ncbi:GNAT family N-acetyltransferase [Sediminibacterium ginsengisoli]|uniref:Protein N-acetyltransferase, RimJ/RimL family n=1 Tax=Sediminibacterium ginsengisoli TaxID=413434 RepID=A0A1T4LBF5_9BACT|nr:GNAT family protein [Sediminibacterium ginsengisoli]SJZ51837.1 Protein N-acetyltransferase, RimJ/RimL family [Sediminibacterium ginsengisoli]
MNFRFEKDIVLENDVICLMPVAKQDTENLSAAAASDRRLLQYSPKQVYTQEMLTAYVDAAIMLREAEIRYSFSIFSKTQGRYAGSTAFLNISNADDRLEIGATWLGKEFQGTGMNRQCKYLMLEFAFDQLHANRVEFKTDERNIQSRKAIEKLGAKYEGTLREHMLVQDGFRRNTFCYSILKHEWAGIETMLLNDI